MTTTLEKIDEALLYVLQANLPIDVSLISSLRTTEEEALSDWENNLSDEDTDDDLYANNKKIPKNIPDLPNSPQINTEIPQNTQNIPNLTIDKSKTSDEKTVEKSTTKQPEIETVEDTKEDSDPNELVSLEVNGVVLKCSRGNLNDFVEMMGGFENVRILDKKNKDKISKPSPPKKEFPDTVLNGNISLDAFVNAIKTGKIKKIITMAGAGISTSCGIPDFRTPGTGLYDNLKEYNLSKPEDIFSIGFFRKDPKPFCILAKSLYPTNFKPSITHYFIKLLEMKGLLHRHYTQNIDGLEKLAGVSTDKLVEAHGSFSNCHCIECGKTYPTDYVKNLIFSDKIPRCTVKTCNGIIKPDIVFFGEGLPKRFHNLHYKDFHNNCDLLIVMGTSLKVSPFCDLIHEVKVTTPRMLINLEPAGLASDSLNTMNFLRLLFSDGGGSGKGFLFDNKDKNYRDFFLKGTCDDGCLKIIKMLGWEKEFNQMKMSNDKKLDELYHSGAKKKEKN